MKPATPRAFDVRPADYIPGKSAQINCEQFDLDVMRIFLAHPIMRGRRRWLAAMPACLLDPGRSELSNDDEKDLVDAAIKARSSEPLGVFSPQRDRVFRDGRWYYAAVFFEETASFLAMPLTAEAFGAFLRTIDKDPALVHAPPPPSKRRPTAPGSRGTSAARRHRGPAWEPWEDHVLRSWFGKRQFGEHEGRHAPLTETQWDIVLQGHLKGRRTKAHVKARISVLNRMLRKTMLVDGFLPRDKVVEFMDAALGEHRIRVPRFRPRIKGRSYRGDTARPVIGQPP